MNLNLNNDYLQARNSWNHVASPRSEGGPSSGTADDSEVLGRLGKRRNFDTKIWANC